MGRAIGVTNSEISMMFWIIYFIFNIIILKMVWDVWLQSGYITFMLIIFLLFIGTIFSFMAVFWPNYIISKFNLNLFTDRITNPDYIGWIRFTRSKGIRPHIVKKGPMGQTKGVAYDEKADVFNNGDYTVTLANGNKAIVVLDMIDHNVNLEENAHWMLIKKHFGVIGYKAWEKCADDKRLLFKDEETDKVGEDVDDRGQEEGL